MFYHIHCDARVFEKFEMFAKNRYNINVGDDFDRKNRG
jgi:hypothetical protein